MFCRNLLLVHIRLFWVVVSFSKSLFLPPIFSATSQMCLPTFLQLEALLKSLVVPITREKFDGPSSTIEPLLLEFQSLCSRAKKTSSTVHHQWVELRERLGNASALGKEAGSKVDYSAEEAREVKMDEDLQRKEAEVWAECARRERRWQLTVQLNQFEPDVDKVSYKRCPATWPSK